MKTLAIMAALLAALAWKFTHTPSWTEFKKSYIPHYRLPDPGNKAVQVVSYMEASTAAGILEEYVQDKEYKMFRLIITSLDRSKAGDILNNMETVYALKGLKALDPEWQKELLWFTSEKTYDALCGKLGMFEK